MTEIILTPIYKPVFLCFSYGFRPGRGAHDALDAPAVAINRRKVNWVVDRDIQRLFYTVSRDWLVRFLEHRIGGSAGVVLMRIRRPGWTKLAVGEADYRPQASRRIDPDRQGLQTRETKELHRACRHLGCSDGPSERCLKNFLLFGSGWSSPGVAAALWTAFCTDMAKERR